MNKIKKFILWLSILVAALLAISLGSVGYYFSEKVVTSGEAYGFKIGATRAETFERATQALQNRQAVALHTWPHNQFHKEFLPKENPVNNNDPRWVLVVDPTWWNNTVTLSFADGRLVEIRRDHYIWELP
jgi:hypothetical protein